MKNKLRNQLTTHLDVIIQVFVQKFYILLKVFFMIKLLKNGTIIDMKLMFNYFSLILGNDVIFCSWASGQWACCHFPLCLLHL
jgi:hypothetical protein